MDDLQLTKQYTLNNLQELEAWQNVYKEHFLTYTFSVSGVFINMTFQK